MQTLTALPFIAGDAALDFVNTAEERGHPQADDALRTPADLATWGVRYGVLEAAVQVDRKEFSRAVEARELLYRLFFTRVHGGADKPADVDRLAALTADAYRAAELTARPDGGLEWRWNPREPATVRHVTVAAATALLTGPLPVRLKQCPGDHCGWFFLDATKRGNRRWCAMGDCGQVAKSARRRSRTAG